MRPGSLATSSLVAVTVPLTGLLRGPTHLPDFDGDAADLKTGSDALAAFEEKVNADGFGGC